MPPVTIVSCGRHCHESGIRYFLASRTLRPAFIRHGTATRSGQSSACRTSAARLDEIWIALESRWWPPTTVQAVAFISRASTEATDAATPGHRTAPPAGGARRIRASSLGSRSYRLRATFCGEEQQRAGRPMRPWRVSRLALGAGSKRSDDRRTRLERSCRMNRPQYYAHSTPQDRQQWQRLSVHLEATATRAAAFLVVCPRNGFTSPACSRRDRRTPDFRDDSRPPCWGTVTFEL